VANSINTNAAIMRLLEEKYFCIVPSGISINIDHKLPSPRKIPIKRGEPMINPKKNTVIR